jgi:hypothetical protein
MPTNKAAAQRAILFLYGVFVKNSPYKNRGSNRNCDFQMLVVEDYEHYNGAPTDRPSGSVA